jgi:hypothetical protein
MNCLFLCEAKTVERVALLVGLAALVGASGCGDDAPPVPTIRTDELHCDIGTSECQHRIYDSVAAMLGVEGIERPAIRTISVDQHAQEVRAGLDLEDLTGEDATTRGLRLLGFIPATSESLTETQVEYWINAIAAYYSRGNRSITVVDRNYDEIDGQMILAHEFTHAIQDIQFNLNTVSANAHTEDGVMGVRGVIEGDATHTSLAWVYEKLGYLPDEIDWDAIHKERTDYARESAGDPEVALIDSAASFPYAYGLDLMTAVTLAGGLSARAAAFELPPTTAVEVMAGYGAELPALDVPQVAHPSPIDGYATEDENRFGAWYVYAFLRRRGMSDDEAWMTALSWVGDELAIYDDGNDVVATWRVRFDDALKAGILRDLVNADSREVAWLAVLYEDDVFVFAAESDETLLAWAAQPLDSVEASLVPKGARRGGGAISPGNCAQSRHFSLPNPPPLLH